MVHSQYVNHPFGTENSKIPMAEIMGNNIKRKEVNDLYLKKLQSFQLNHSQIEAVQHFTGPILTIAGAGSGKTSVLVCRTGYLINVHHVSPRNILLVTFTKKAAEEMKGRLAQLPGITNQMARTVQASTFHSFFLTVLRSQGYQQKIISNERFKQIVIKNLLKEKGKEDLYEPETLLALFSSWKMNMVNPKTSDIGKTVGEAIVEIYQKYEQWKEANQQMDFDDILTRSYHLLVENPNLLTMLQDRFRYIMVDEFQDTNLLQYQLIKMLAERHQNLMVVGDDDQTIYSFNGARNELILNFHKEFPQTKEVILTMNYRSHAAIVGLGNEIIKYNAKRKKKTLTATVESDKVPQFNRPNSVDEEADSVVRQIKYLVDKGQFQYQDIAILYRATSNSRAIFEQLMLEKLPFIHYSQGDMLFYDQWVVKPVIDYLRVAFNPKNIPAMEGILPTLFIKKELGMGYISLNNQLQPKDYPLEHLKDLPSNKPFQKRTIDERIDFIKKINKLSPLVAIKKIRKDFYDKYTESTERSSMTLDKEAIKEMLDELETSAKRFETIAEFLTFIDKMKEMQLEAKKGTGVNKDQIQLMTIHKAKGLEFPVVFLIGASEGILPHNTALEAEKIEKVTKEEREVLKQEAVEEERRLAYVAVTRAKEELYVSSPAFYRGKDAKVSRFFLEAFGESLPEKRETLSNYRPKRTYTNSMGRKITVLAWLCSSKNCNAWVRITTTEEADLSHKQCPLCKAKMDKGEKIVSE